MRGALLEHAQSCINLLGVAHQALNAAILSEIKILTAKKSQVDITFDKFSKLRLINLAHYSLINLVNYGLS